MPTGRFVCGTTETSLGEVTVVGICIPWSGSRVRWTTEKRRMWEDHHDYLDGLARVLRSLPSRHLIIMGDFNQRFGQGDTVPAELRSALQDAMPSGVTIATSAVGLRARRTIDHIALGDELATESLGAIDNLDKGRRLSDHFGVYAYLLGEDRP